MYTRDVTACFTGHRQFHEPAANITARISADASSACIAYMTRANSGTGYTVRYAQEHGLQVINLAGPARRSGI